jgi:hypothetical protein
MLSQVAPQEGLRGIPWVIVIYLVLLVLFVLILIFVTIGTIYWGECSSAAPVVVSPKRTH